MNNNIDNGLITIFLDSLLFSKDSIFKCLYWYGDRFHTTVSLIDNGTKYMVTIKPFESSANVGGDLKLYQLKLERDFIDFNLRDIVTKETQNVKDLLIAKAFSNGEFDESPQGNLSDPVGFNPKENIS